MKKDVERPNLARALIDASMAGLIAIDATGTIIAFNHAAGKIFGHEPAEILGSRLDVLMTPENVEKHQQKINEFFAGDFQDILGKSLEFFAMHSSGEKIPVELTLSRTDVDDEPVVMAVVRDLSKRQEAERRNRTLEEQLTQAQKMEALGTLAAGVAHDFNNMLGAIMGYASAMNRELDKSHHHYQDVNQILMVARLARRLTDKLLVFSRQSDSIREPLSVNLVVRSVIGLLQRTIPKNIVFKTKLAKTIFTQGDRTQIEQMLLNICLNARDAMPNGGEIKIKTSTVTLGEDAAKPLGLEAGDYGELIIEDTGVGMDPDTCSRVFNPFFSTKPKGEGSGLGLALVFNTVKNHDGCVRVASEPGQGTTMTVYLPHTSQKPVPEQRSAIAEFKMRGKGELILLVDDEKHLREMAKRLLEGLGYEVILAECGEEAEALFRQQQGEIDLVILDVMMAGLSGEETLDRLREIDRNVKVLVSSGFNREGEPKHLLRKGVCGFVQKPYGIEEVGVAIHQALHP